MSNYEFKTYHKNPRNLSKKQEADLRRWLRELGDLSGIVHNELTDEIIGGNQRSHVFDIRNCDIEFSVEYQEPTAQGTTAQGYINWNGERYTYRRVRWTKEQCEKANIIANKAGGTWDFDILANQFDKDDLLEWGFEGFEFGDGSEEQKEVKEDDFEVKDNIETDIVVGDLFEFFGKDGQYHRLLCGDSTDKATVEMLMDGNQADMVFTDPMYQDSPLPIISIFDFLETKYFLIMATFKQCISFVNDSDYRFRFDLVLNQKVQSSTMNKKVPYYLHKNLIYLTKDDSTIFHCDNAIGYFSEKGYYPSLIESAKNTSEAHGLTKNAKGIMLILSGFDFKIVLDLFIGSGSTMVAAHNLNRNCYGMELEPKYCQVIIDRMMKLDESIEVKKNGLEYKKQETIF